MDDARFQADLRRYWDELVEGGPAAPEDLDPELLTLIRRLHALGEVRPDAAYATRLRESLMQTTAIAHPHVEPLARPGLNGKSTPPARRALVPLPPVSGRPWAMAQLATAAPLLVTLVSSFLVFGRGQPGRLGSAPAILPVVIATPAMPSPEAVSALAEFVQEITLGADNDSAATGVVVDAEGAVYVIDALQDHIRVFARDGTSVATWGESDTAPGQFTFKEGDVSWGDLAIGPDGNLYVLDSFNQRVQVLAPDGRFLREWGESGEEDGQFDEPSGIGIDAAGRVYVTDRQRLQIFEADGHFVGSWNGSQSKGATFLAPGDVAVDAEGVISVIDVVGGRVSRFDPAGTLIAAIPSVGAQERQFAGPWGVAVDAAGNLYVAEHGGSRVQVLDPEGTALGTVGSLGTEPGQFVNPLFLAVSPDGLLYVTDATTGRVLVFRLLPPLETATNPSAPS